MTAASSSNPHSQASAGDLKIELQQVSSDPPCIRAVVSNRNPTTPMTVLAWDNILDDKALNGGIFSIEEVDSKKQIKGPGLMINRLLPPPREALVEVAPASQVRKDFTLQSRWIPKDGKTYNVKANGSWKAIWPKAATDVTDDELAAMSGSGVLQGDFESSEVEMILS